MERTAPSCPINLSGPHCQWHDGIVRSTFLVAFGIDYAFIQIRWSWCLLGEFDRLNDPEQHWCQELYEAKAGELVLYGRALGLSHAESEDVVQETFMALMKLTERPRQPLFYCLRSFRNRALNYRRGLWR